MVARPVVSVDAESDARFDRAFEFLKTRVDLNEANERHPVRENAVYTTAVVLWMLVYQRMSPDTSLEAAVKKLIDSKPDFLPDNKRVTDDTLSTNTSSYSQARSRMPLQAAEWFTQQVSQSLIDVTAAGQRRHGRFRIRYFRCRISDGICRAWVCAADDKATVCFFDEEGRTD